MTASRDETACESPNKPDIDNDSNLNKVEQPKTMDDIGERR